MKAKFFLFFLILSFLVACGSDEEGNDQQNAETSDNDVEKDQETPDSSLPDAPEDNSEKEVPDENKSPESFCYSGGAILYEGDQQFKVCASDPEKFQKQICQHNRWVDDGECVSGTVSVPAGSFKMGCDETIEKKCPEDTVPLHEVALSGYVIDKFEVPVELFQKCIDENVCTNENTEEPHYRTYSENDECNIGNPDRLNHPANCVTWHGAKAYCEWLGKRLPTEAEWENAAKSGKNRIYPWGDTPKANCKNNVMYDKEKGDGCGNNVTFPIGSKPNGVSDWGIYDFAGNAAEYTGDWYEKHFYSSEEASQKDTQGPAEPEKNKSKVVRGGSFIYGEDRARASFRSSAELDDPAINLGFRCVSSPK